MGILRSEEMTPCTLVLPFEKAYNMLNCLGHKTNMQVLDMNGDQVYRPYKRYIQRLDEMDRIIRFLVENVIGELGMGEKVTRNRDADFLANESVYTMDALESELLSYYEKFSKFRANNAALEAELGAAKEELEVVKLGSATLTDAGSALPGTLDTALLEDTRQVNEDGLAFANIAGVISAVDQERFAKTIFRATRGNAYVTFQTCDTGEKGAAKSTFAIFFQGSASSSITNKVKRLCQAFNANLYAYPATKAQAFQRIEALNVTIREKESVLMAFQARSKAEVEVLIKEVRPGVSCSRIEEWRLFTAKSKNIYATLNLFEGTSTLRANAWVPTANVEPIQDILKEQSLVQGASALLIVNPPTKKMPPTYIKTNELSAAFQELVDTYGIPRYQESNPTLFAIVTFPFLFGIMYGDVGHGFCLFCAGCYIMLNSDSMKMSQNDTVRSIAWARYLITAMGFFAIYAGFMYNDLFSLGIALFDTRWTEGEPVDGNINWTPNFDITNGGDPDLGGPYPFGVDPAWHGATNELLFLNSMKMKLSVLVGVLQMLLGVFLRFGNTIYVGSKLDFFCECIPMLVFMLCFFGWMDFLIMYKWVNPVDTQPSIINSLICMGLGAEDKAPMFDGSTDVAAMNMVLCLIAVPTLWIPKPIIEMMMHKKAAKPAAHEGDLESQALAHHDDEEHEEFDIGEVFIHQTIETIEYVLGTVSHTASYLRLWALSLAHQQLSLVFFQKSVLGQISPDLDPMFGSVILFLGAGVWFAITAAVLLGMDVLECFLHTLRLHWVEFQSKFYKADGYKYEPFTHQAALTAASKS